MSFRRGAPVFLLAIILLNLFVLSSNAQQSISTIPCILTSSSVTVGTCMASAIPLSLIGIGISLIFIALIYMVGNVMGYGKLKDFYKLEVWETVKSMIVIVLIFSSLVIASGLAVSFAGTSPQLSGNTVPTISNSITNNLASLYTTADSSYLSPQLQSAQTTFGALMGLSVGSDLIKSLVLEVWLPVPIPSQAGIIGAVQFGAQSSLLVSNYITELYGGPSLSVAAFATDAVLVVMLILQVQHDLLYTIAALGLGVLIPVGVIMRALPFTRGVGGTLIAMGIGISIIYPAILVGFNLPVSNYIFTMSSSVAVRGGCGILPSLICSIINSGINLATTVPGLATGTVPLAIAFGANSPTLSGATLSGSGFWTGALGAFGIVGKVGIFPSLNFVIDNSLNQLLQFLLFIIDIVMGVALSQGIARLLGGDIALGVGKRFKLA